MYSGDESGLSINNDQGGIPAYSLALALFSKKAACRSGCCHLARLDSLLLFLCVCGDLLRSLRFC